MPCISVFRLPPHHIPLLPPGSVRQILYQLFLVRISLHQLILITYIAFIGHAPSAIARAFAVAGWQPSTLPQSSNIIVDSFQEHLESGERALLQSLERSLRYLAAYLVVVGCSILCFHSRMVHPIAEKIKVQITFDLNFITDNMQISLVNLELRFVRSFEMNGVFTCINGLSLTI